MGQKGSKKFEGVWNDVAVPRESMSIVEGAPPHLNWPQALELNKDLLNQEETLAASLLVSMDQAHLFENWDLPGINDDKKHNFFKQVHELSSTYLPGQGGLIAYINNARTLLEKSKNGVNPLEGWIPEVPTGTSLEPFTPEYDRFEQLGLGEVGKCGFVLVAGGLGERLGYNGIKISLPTETLTNTSYIELYCQQILAIQQRYGRHVESSEATLNHVNVTIDGDKEEEVNRIAIPLAIMVSDDTEALTRDLLFRNSYFGLQVFNCLTMSLYLITIKILRNLYVIV
jgi:UDP-sugar pyrophosphorylase